MPGPIEQISEEGWHASVEGNLTATFLTIKSVLPSMKDRKLGNIITISTAAARRPHPSSPIPYAAAKAGIQILTQDLAAQVGPFGIRANCIAPETILTGGNKQRMPDALIQITLGFLFWTGNALSITPIGLLVGLVLALSLWALALLGARANVYPILVIMAVLLGTIIPVLGLTGDWFLCVLASVGAVWQAEEMAACIKDVKPQVLLR